MQFLSDKGFWHLVEEGTDAFRIFTSQGALIERLGRAAMISYFLRSDLEMALKYLDKWVRRIHWSPQWILARQRIKQPENRGVPFLIRGENFSPIQVIHENGLKYEINFSGHSVGFFCDQRSNRWRLMQLQPPNILNCFAYTCTFSVAAASTGSKTFNVDLAKPALSRGRRNFSLNNIVLNGRHQFLVEDVLSILPKLVRRGEKFHCIILDPPTFSRSSHNSYFQVQDHLPCLLKMSLACITSHGCILLSTNCTSIQVRDLRSIVIQVASSVRRSVRLFPSEMQHDTLGGPVPSTIWIEIK